MIAINSANPDPMSRDGAGPRNPVRVVLADDHALTRRTLQRMLESDSRVEIVGIASNGAEAHALAREFHPAVVILDVRMPVLNGFEAARAILDDGPMGIVLISSFGEPAYRAAAEQLHARFVSKSAPEAELLAAILASQEDGTEPPTE